MGLLSDMLLPRLIWPIRLRRMALRECSPRAPASLSLTSQSQMSNWSCCHLPLRALVKVQGAEAAPFLQGLVTNDINPLVEDDRKRCLIFVGFSCYKSIFFSAFTVPSSTLVAGYSLMQSSPKQKMRENFFWMWTVLWQKL